MRRLPFSLPALALIAIQSAALPAAAQQANDFQLPPPSPRPDEQKQGPVDPDAPVLSRPRAIETATPEPAPSASPSPTPSAAQPATPAVRTSAAPPAVRTAPSATPALPGQGDPQPIVAAPASAAQTGATPTAEATIAPVPPPPVTADAQTSYPWAWVALAAILGFAAAALLFRRRRSDPVPPAIERPVVPSAPPAPRPPADPLALVIEATRFDRSLFNATVSYRITARNRGQAALDGVAVEADLVTASAERPPESQLAAPSQALEPLHRLEQLQAGESRVFEGQVRLPLAQATAIRQGSVGLLVPLLRVRATAAGTVPVAATLVLGPATGPSARPQPFRLDDPPRSYAPLAQRLLDAVPAPA